MFLRVVASSVLALSVCIPHVVSAHSPVKPTEKHGDVTYYYSANGRVYAKEINNVMYYRSSPEYLVRGYTGPDVHTHQTSPYYAQYSYIGYSEEDNQYKPIPYHWSYIYRVR